MATIRASVLDVFNQNTGYSSTQTSSYSTQTNANRLGRYYLLTFTYRFQKLAGKTPDRGPGGFRGGPGGGGPPPVAAVLVARQLIDFCNTINYLTSI